MKYSKPKRSLEEERSYYITQMEEQVELLDFGVFNRLKWVSVMTILNRIDQQILDKKNEEIQRKKNAELYKCRNKDIRLTGWEIYIQDCLSHES